MSQSWNLNGVGQVERHHEEDSTDSLYSTLERTSPFVGPDVLPRKNGSVVATGPHIVLTCGPHDDDKEDEE